MVSSWRRGGIFISYRREESAAQAGRLYDRLSDRFGEDRVFMDVDSIAIGTDFTRAVIRAVSGCNILLALIGRNWPAITDSTGRRRIDDPDDFVRVEIETALHRDIRVVPVLVDGAVLPQAGDLPPSLRSLIQRQALGLSHAGFRLEVSRLIAAVEEVLGAEPGRTATQAGGGSQAAAKTEPPTHVVDAYQRGDFATVSAAIKAARSRVTGSWCGRGCMRKAWWWTSRWRSSATARSPTSRSGPAALMCCFPGQHRPGGEPDAAPGRRRGNMVRRGHHPGAAGPGRLRHQQPEHVVRRDPRWRGPAAAPQPDPRRQARRRLRL